MAGAAGLAGRGSGRPTAAPRADRGDGRLGRSGARSGRAVARCAAGCGTGSGAPVTRAGSPTMSEPSWRPAAKVSVASSRRRGGVTAGCAPSRSGWPLRVVLMVSTGAVAVQQWRVAQHQRDVSMAERLGVQARALALDAAWLAVVEHVQATLPGLPLVFGGRSSGARVACRTATVGVAVGCCARRSRCTLWASREGPSVRARLAAGPGARCAG